jgi:hypothetical protein
MENDPIVRTTAYLCTRFAPLMQELSNIQVLYKHYNTLPEHIPEKLNGRSSRLVGHLLSDFFDLFGHVQIAKFPAVRSICPIFLLA